MAASHFHPDLSVIERLEIGPVQMQPDKLEMPYQIHQQQEIFINHLSYHWEEAVFDPQDQRDQNLASMIGAQVALNYGLFCKEMIFRGPFDDHDIQFIRTMIENTAIEIAVKKFLEPNPFLKIDTSNLEFDPGKSFCQADLSFPDAFESRSYTPAMPETSMHGILSSGGKESLLSFGVLNELNRSPHPIFINESGRHWYTALNGYRYLQTRFPQTARVWTNADRIFNWMLRHMPFIRRDFNRIRADEYPLRLWTVAVFLFGALPLVIKRGINRILIGDEYDTTRKAETRGITHYDGLYDQSRYFDHALSRYYAQKGWAIKQFSLLRPLSEFMIEKMLVQRYPDLQEHQISCHAAHIEENRVKPCGKCEKCRRIVGMVIAMGSDPQKCGYTPQQIRNCLQALEKESIHQEAEGAEHLLAVLQEKKIITPWLKTSRHTEIESLRFHPEFSPIDELPPDLFRIYKIFSQYAENILVWQKNQWQSALLEQLL